jgi:allophanate hydrolase
MRGGATDPLAPAEGAALPGQEPLAAIEIAGSFADVAFDAPARIALTGAPMRATAAAALQWNAAHALHAGARLVLSGSVGGIPA